MDLAAQRANELIDQKETLRREFAAWRARSQANQPLEKHNSQIARLTTQLESFLAAVQDPNLDAPSFAENERIYTRLLGAHRIWAYFRSKLALRDVDWLGGDLQCAGAPAGGCHPPGARHGGGAGAIAPSAPHEPAPGRFFHHRSPVAPARPAPPSPGFSGGS